MSEHYLTWDNQEYPWPPPEGWHKEAGRWWPPNSGPPTAPPTTTTTTTTTPGDARDQASFSDSSPTLPTPEIHLDNTGARLPTPKTSQDVNATSQVPKISIDQVPAPKSRQPHFGTAPRIPASKSEKPQLDQTTARDVAGSRLPQASRTSIPNQGFEPRRHGDPTPRRSTTSSLTDGNNLLMILAGVSALVFLAGLGFYLATRGSGASATDPSVASQDTQAETSTSTEATPSTEAPVDPEILAGFRTYVTELNIVGLTDARLNDIGKESCAAANLSADAAGWETQMGNIIATIQEAQAATPPEDGDPLDEETIREIYEGAVTFYCPTDAERLGLTV